MSWDGGTSIEMRIVSADLADTVRGWAKEQMRGILDESDWLGEDGAFSDFEDCECTGNVTYEVASDDTVIIRVSELEAPLEAECEMPHGISDVAGFFEFLVRTMHMSEGLYEACAQGLYTLNAHAKSVRIECQEVIPWQDEDGMFCCGVYTYDKERAFDSLEISRDPNDVTGQLRTMMDMWGLR